MKTVDIEASKFFGFDKRPKEGKLEPAKVYCGECKYFSGGYSDEERWCSNAHCEPMKDSPLMAWFNYGNYKKFNARNCCSYFEQVSHDPVIEKKNVCERIDWDNKVYCLVASFVFFALVGVFIFLIYQAVIK